MHYYLLLRPQMRLEDPTRARRPSQSRLAQRVYQIPADGRTGRNGWRR